MSTNNMNKSWSNKWKTNKTRKTERKWTLWNFFIIRPLWKQPLDKMKISKRQKSEDEGLFWFVKLYYLSNL